MKNLSEITPKNNILSYEVLCGINDNFGSCGFFKTYRDAKIKLTIVMSDYSLSQQKHQSFRKKIREVYLTVEQAESLLPDDKGIYPLQKAMKKYYENNKQ